MRLLLVEDSAPTRSVIRSMLTQLGYTDVAEAADGGEAWAHLCHTHFDLLLTDWNMPKMSGLELLQHVRATPELRYLPVVMLTTRGNKDDIVSAIKAGVDNYVTKPCKTSQLKEKIDRAILQEAQKQAKGGGAVEVAERIIGGCRKFHPQQEGPYVLFVEGAADVDALSRGRSQDLLRFYSQVTEILARLSAEGPAAGIGYSIEQDTKQVVRLVRGGGSGVALLLVSGRTAEGPSLARLLGSRRDPGFPPVHLMCDSVTGLDPSVREGMARVGVELAVRSQLVRGNLEHLIRQVLPTAAPPPVAPPAPHGGPSPDEEEGA